KAADALVVVGRRGTILHPVAGPAFRGGALLSKCRRRPCDRRTIVICIARHRPECERCSELLPSNVPLLGTGPGKPAGGVGDGGERASPGACQAPAAPFEREPRFSWS